ncbi:MAG: YHS domain-containing (seleno)protein, partial [Cyanobacteria bacterium P01_H01_bin.121]
VADPCAGADPCAAKSTDPCAAKNPCAGADPCAAKGTDPCAAKNPCAGADPCAAKSVDPCAGAKNPCAGANPCAAKASGTSTVAYFVEDGVAIRGADPVAYFTEGAPVQGKSEFSYEWNGAKWQFSSAENRDLFASNPEEYAPQYGGFCAWAVSQGYTAPVDPEAWRIVDGKLYLNFDQSVQRRWAQDIPGNIAQANANWPAVLQQSS